MGQFKSLKQISCKFKGQSELKGEGQGHKFKNLTHLDDQQTAQVEANISKGSNVVTFMRNCTKF